MTGKKKNKALPLIIGVCVIAALVVVLIFTQRAADTYEEEESQTDTLMDITADDIKSFSYTDYTMTYDTEAEDADAAGDVSASDATGTDDSAGEQTASDLTEEELEAEAEGSTISFTREEGQWVSDTAPSMEVDQTTVGTTASSLTGITLSQTIEGVTDLAQYGLDTPIYGISITDMDGNTTTIALGDTNATTSTIYAYLNGDTSTVYAISTGITANLSKTLNDYEAESDSEAESTTE